MAAAKYGIESSEFVDFSVNINPLGPPPEIESVLRDAVRLASLYPEPDCGALKESAAAFLGICPEQVVFSNGAIELIYLAVQALRPGRVLIPGPTFKEYELAARIWGAKVKHFRLSPRAGFVPDLDHLMKAAGDVDMVFLCSPNNPSGNLIPSSVLKPFLDFCAERSIFVLLDESFLFFHPSWEELSCIGEASKNKYLFVIHSLTKFFAVPGLRIGYGVAHAETAGFLSGFQPPWQVNSLAQAAGEVLFKSNAYACKTREFLLKERSFMESALSSVPHLKVYPSDANFFLLELEEPLTAPLMEDFLARRRILVRNCSNFAFLGDAFIRVAVKWRDQNLFLIKNLEEVVSERGH